MRSGAPSTVVKASTALPPDPTLTTRIPQRVAAAYQEGGSLDAAAGRVTNLTIMGSRDGTKGAVSAQEGAWLKPSGHPVVWRL